jgi:hypothetical protein
MSDPSQPYTPPLLPPGTVLGGRYRLVEPLVGVDDSVIAGGWLGADQQLGDRRVVVRVAGNADPEWINSREAFGNVAAPLLDSIPVENGSALVWRLPSQAVKWDSSSLSREQRASMLVGLYRAISIDTSATSWVSDAALFALPTALGARPWVAPAERHGHTPDSARAENLHALAKLALSVLFGVADPSDADVLARLPSGLFESLEPWLSDSAEERLAHTISPLELATALGVTEGSERVPVPTATVSKSASTKNRVASARALAKRVSKRERIAFVVLLVVLALGYLGLFASSPRWEGSTREPAPARAVIEVAPAANTLERADERTRLSMPDLELTAVTTAAFLRPAASAEICRQASYIGPVPTLLGCGADIYAYEPRVHVFRDAEGRIDLIESYDRLDRPTSRSRFRYGAKDLLDQITTTSVTMVTQDVEHIDLETGLFVEDPAYADDGADECWQWHATFTEDGHYEQLSCGERDEGTLRYEYGERQYRVFFHDGRSSLVSWDEQGRSRCSEWTSASGETEYRTCHAYSSSSKETSHTVFSGGLTAESWVERTDYAESGRALRMRRIGGDGMPYNRGGDGTPAGYDYECLTEHGVVNCQRAIGLTGSPDVGYNTYDTLVTVEDGLGNPVIVVSERDGDVVSTEIGEPYSRVLRTYDAGGRVTSLSYWDVEELASTDNGVHRYEWNYESGLRPIEERRYDASGSPLTGFYNRVVWDRDSTGATNEIVYMKGRTRLGSVQLERNGEGRVARRCASPRLSGRAIAGVHCVESEWRGLDHVRLWFTGPLVSGALSVVATFQGQAVTGVELAFRDGEPRTMTMLWPGDRVAGTSSGSEFACSSTRCLGISGVWFADEEPGGLLR